MEPTEQQLIKAMGITDTTWEDEYTQYVTECRHAGVIPQTFERWFADDQLTWEDEDFNTWNGSPESRNPSLGGFL